MVERALKFGIDLHSNSEFVKGLVGGITTKITIPDDYAMKCNKRLVHTNKLRSRAKSAQDSLNDAYTALGVTAVV